MQVLRYLHFYQIKNFRLDRLYCLIFKESGMKKVFNLFSLPLYICTFVFYQYSSSPVFLIILLLNILNSKLIGFYRPKFTPKLIVILGLTLILDAFVLRMMSINFLYAFNLLLSLFLILPLMPLNYFLKQMYIYRAKKKIQKFKNLKVIGVTGSFGKSSTKNLIHSLLKQKYKVLATQGNLNTEIGIAKMILSKLNSSHEILLLEMGAYKKGEIKKILEITPLDFSVLMAVSNQHLALFKTRENLMQAKAEIFSNLNQNARVYINFEAVSKDVLSLVPKGHEITGFQKKNQDFKLISRFPKLHIIIGKNDYSLNLFAPYLEANLYLAIKLALDLELEVKGIQKTLLNLEIFENFMHLKGSNPQFIIDDYNSTQAGVLNMIKTIKNEFKPNQKRMFLFSGIIELGNEELVVHNEILKSADEVFDLIVLPKKLNNSFESKKIVSFDGDTEKLNLFLTNEFGKLDLVYVAGRQYGTTKNLIENYEG